MDKGKGNGADFEWNFAKYGQI